MFIVNICYHDIHENQYFEVYNFNYCLLMSFIVCAVTCAII